ncbi:sensor histidine kinase [Streptomyces montanisoli]|uniref:histidine kinase n=1 Tax=Streptomyces montanisoli TaxID=2798581 RepID=A0A940RVP1_9ACTN|nr:HAMP domain-containing sensor histidine kinase [Streptomyces montanisoli]MBP0458560.1 HAMP domain-containing histidine kinase [Streptomyces montanisoli]
MRRRVVRVAVVSVLVALVLFALPLGAALRAYLFADERNELEREALAAAVRVGPDFASGDRVELPPAPPGVRIGVYDMSLRRQAGAGPRKAGSAARRAARGSVFAAHTTADGALVTAVPVSRNEQVVGIVRASTDTGGLWWHVAEGWLALVATALVALGAAILAARRQARALTKPLESLSRQCRAVAGGDLSARASPSAIAEIDQVARTHNDMVSSISRLLERERNFAANASHQLRTPLTGLQLALEAALTNPHADLRAALEEASDSSRRLQTTVDEVLALAHSRRPDSLTGVAELGTVLDALEHRWHGLLALGDRRLTVQSESSARARHVPRVCGQILDALLDNARVHGQGTVEVRVREVGGAAAIDVADEGHISTGTTVLFARGQSGGAGTGIGLALARELAESAGCRLNLARADPSMFTLLCPPE